MGNITYPVGNYNFDNKILEIKTKNNKYYRINPLATIINEDRTCCVLLEYWEYSESGALITSAEASYSGKVQLSKIPGYEYEVLAQFKGQRIHIPFYL